MCEWTNKHVMKNKLTVALLLIFGFCFAACGKDGELGFYENLASIAFGEQATLFSLAPDPKDKEAVIYRFAASAYGYWSADRHGSIRRTEMVDAMIWSTYSQMLKAMPELTNRICFDPYEGFGSGDKRKPRPLISMTPEQYRESLSEFRKFISTKFDSQKVHGELIEIGN